MTYSISILGLGRIGTSAGLALGRVPGLFLRRGYDPNIGTMQQAQSAGALNQIDPNPIDNIKDSDIILVCLPAREFKHTIEKIAPHIRENCLLLDSSPLKAANADWIKSKLPPNCQYIGITPAINPRYWNDPDDSPQSAHADLFEAMPMGIAVLTGCPPETVDMAILILKSLGTKPIFCDLAEMDGFHSTNHLLPMLVSAVLMQTEYRQPGWREAGKFAGQDLTRMSADLAEEVDVSPLAEQVIHNQVDLKTRLGFFQANLKELLGMIESGNAVLLEEWLKNTQIERENWLAAIHKSGTPAESIPTLEMPRAGDYWKQQAGFLARPHNKKPTRK